MFSWYVVIIENSCYIELVKEWFSHIKLFLDIEIDYNKPAN